jgi:hypothetical protein
MHSRCNRRSREICFRLDVHCVPKVTGSLEFLLQKEKAATKVVTIVMSGGRNLNLQSSDHIVPWENMNCVLTLYEGMKANGRYLC